MLTYAYPPNMADYPFIEHAFQGLRDRPRCGRPRSILRNVMDGMVANVVGCCITDDLLCVRAALVQHVAQSLTE